LQLNPPAWAGTDIASASAAAAIMSDNTKSQVAFLPFICESSFPEVAAIRRRAGRSPVAPTSGREHTPIIGIVNTLMRGIM
jgi:hypothetical protein